METNEDKTIECPLCKGATSMEEVTSFIEKITEKAIKKFIDKLEDEEVVDTTITVDKSARQDVREFLKEEIQKARLDERQKILEKFDKYACIKDDKWLQDLKKELLLE